MDARTNALVVAQSSVGVADGPLFSGDGPCPTCKTLLWIDLRFDFDSMKCPTCGHTFDGEQAIAIVCSHAPENNQGDFSKVREAMRSKNVLRILATVTPRVEKEMAEHDARKKEEEELHQWYDEQESAILQRIESLKKTMEWAPLATSFGLLAGDMQGVDMKMLQFQQMETQINQLQQTLLQLRAERDRRLG